LYILADHQRFENLHLPINTNVLTFDNQLYEEKLLETIYTDIDTGRLQPDFRERLIRFVLTMFSFFVISLLFGYLHYEFGDIDEASYVTSVIIQLVGAVMMSI
jgi:hypothetical protein